MLDHRKMLIVRELSLAVAGEKSSADALATVETEMNELAKKDGKLK